MARPTFTKKQIGPDIDLDVEEVFLDDGSRLTEARAAALAEHAMLRIHESRSGRPSLSGERRSTPNLTVRVPPSTRQALQEIASRDGRPLAEIGREAFDEYIERHRRAS
ncbi:MAG: hypothetical protein BGO26_09480 [Actinobacteria bacterium 69-20]|jgi:hypothetical protein|nr:hypothetical protein [Actinomycetota bacterium]OJV23164.1 MAG: hypothetical protein BGO26_09480 [Actinobacteria bacterium 69-20]